MSTQATRADAHFAWTEIFPPFKLGEAATRRYLWFVVLSSLAVYGVGSLNRDGTGLVLAYLFVFSGALGLGWVGILTSSGWDGQRNYERLLRAVRAALGDSCRPTRRCLHRPNDLDDAGRPD